MRTLKSRDPLALKQSPSSASTYLFLVLTIGSLFAGIFLFVLYSKSGSGQVMKNYGTDLEEWRSNDLANKFG